MRARRWAVVGSAVAVTLAVISAGPLVATAAAAPLSDTAAGPLSDTAAGPLAGTAGPDRPRLAVPYGASARTASPAPFDASPPGSNDWACKPGGAHPNPVVLVHGLTANQTVNWQTMAPLLANEGYCVFSLTYGRNPLAPPPLSQVGGLKRMEESAEELAAFVDRVRDATGADKVDIVGHSEGSLMPNYYVKFLGGAEHVQRYVGLTPLWDGTQLAGLAALNNLAGEAGFGPLADAGFAPFCASCRQFLHGSEFLEKMNSGGGPRVRGVDYTMIMTRYDEAVMPYTSGYMDGADNIVLQEGCPNDAAEHGAVAFDPVTAQHVLNALDPDDARPVDCFAHSAARSSGRD